MKIVTDTRGRFVIEGQFWMVQRTDIKKNEFVTPTAPRLDTHGNPRLEWPGGSVFDTLEKAQSVRDLLAKDNPEWVFVVMESKGEVRIPKVPPTKKEVFK